MPGSADSLPVTDRATRGPDVLLVGLDGVNRDVLHPHLSAERMPALASIIERGAVSDLESQIPPWTPSAWPSIFTGVNPGKHGVFDFLSFEGYDWRLVDRSDVDAHALWELLDHHGMRSVVVNVPVTGPPVAFDGALVPGYVAPEDPECHPPGLLDELRDELGDYRVYAPDEIDDEDARSWYRRLVEMRGEAFRYLVDREDPDFGFVQFQQTDTVFHERPEDAETVAAVFEAVDEQLQLILDQCNPETVFVVSDHGIGPYDGYEFRVNEFLRDAGLVAATTGEGGMPSWTELTRERDDESTPPITHRLLSVAARFGITSRRLYRIVSRLRLEDFVLRHVSTDAIRAANERVDFGSSTAYMRSRTELGVRLNVAGRDPEGTVSPAEYPSVRQDVIERLRDVETPDGTPVFETVAPREDYFEGPYVEDAVDVVTIPADWQHYLSASLRGDRFGEPTEPWNHKPTGILVAAGDTLSRTPLLQQPHIFDIAPTVLSALGVPPSERMDGRTLDWIQSVEPDAYPAFEPEGTTVRDTERVEKRLANLGYIDDHEH